MGDDDGCVYSLTKVPLSSFLFIVREIWSGSILELYFENGFVLQLRNGQVDGESHRGASP